MTRLTILFISLFATFQSQKSLVGKYMGTCHKDERFTLDLKSDSTFVQVHHEPSTNTQTEGKWLIKSDTLILKINKVYDFFEKNKKTECTVNDRHYISAQQLTKHIIKGDTLTVLWNRPDKSVRRWCNIIKTE